MATRSKSNSSLSLSDDSDNDEFFQAWAKQRAEVIKSHIDPYSVVQNLLRSTKVPYCIIGGKAAAFYLTAEHASKEGYILATATNDYDIIISSQYRDAFLGEVSNAFSGNNNLENKEYKSDKVDIILIGLKKKRCLRVL